MKKRHLFLATFFIGILMALFGYFYTQTSQAACYSCVIAYYDVFCGASGYTDQDTKCPYGNDGGTYKSGSSGSAACGADNLQVIPPPDWGQCIGDPCAPARVMTFGDPVADSFCTPTCASSCGACTITTTCGQNAYDTCIDNAGNSGTSLCSGTATAYGCYASGNYTCTSSGLALSSPPSAGFYNLSCATCKPSSFTTGTPSCPSPGTSASLPWGSSSGPSDRGSIAYRLRLDDKANGWTGSCSSRNPGDWCDDNATSSLTSPYIYSSTTAGHTYGWWVDACNNAGCARANGSDFSCAASFAFTLGNAANVAVSKGSSVNNNIAVNLAAGTTQAVALSASVVAGDATNVSFDFKDGSGATSSSCSPTCGRTLVIITNSSTLAEAKTIRVTGTSPGATNQTTDFTLTVTEPARFDYTVSSPGNLTLTQGIADTGRNITVTRTTLAAPANVSLSVVNSDNTAFTAASPSFSPTGCTPSTATNTCSTPNLTFTPTAAGTYTGLKIKGVSGSTVRYSPSFNLTVNGQPDLIVDTLSPGSAVSGTFVTFSGRVVNQGNASTAVGTSARLRYASIAGGSLDTTSISKSVGVLAASGSQVVTWTGEWPATGAGNHSYEICADTPTSFVAESNEGNNCTTGTLNVTTSAIPDLTTSLNSVTAKQTGNIVTFTGRVSNIGSAGIASGTTFTTRFCIDSSSTNCFTSATGRIGTDQATSGPINAGASTADFNSSTWTATVGSHTVYLCTDVGNVITEANEGAVSNCSSQVFTVTDAAVASITLTGTGSPSSACIAPYADLSWTSSGLPASPTFTLYRSSTSLGSKTSPVHDTGLTAGTTYNYQVISGSTTSNILSLTPASCTGTSTGTPWIQTIGGDVHSNIKINTPGGP